MSKILFVVHRAAPYPGGSEYFVQDMAEEMLARGHEVWTLAETHQGDYNGVKMTSDYNVLVKPWDLIIVHGSDVISQNIVHANGHTIGEVGNKVCYMIIKPSESPVSLNGLKQHTYVAYSTKKDIEHIKKHGVLDKARRIRHGIVPKNTYGAITRNKSGQKRIYMSAGGFYHHKAMIPLARAFEDANLPDSELHLYGYGEGLTLTDTDKVKWFKGKSKQEVMDAMASSDGYIMNSYEEGFGLVLLEAMMNKVPWYARAGSGAADELANYGTTYKDEAELMSWLSNPFAKLSLKVQVRDAYEYVMANHTITQTCNDIEDILNG